MTASSTPGSTIVLYTDGLVEERGVSIDQGLEALRLAASQDPCHPDELCDRLVDSMLAIHPANDDIAVLALRALPTAPPPLHLEVPSDPTELRQMRRDLGSWLREAGARRRGRGGHPDRLPRGVLELDRARLRIRRRPAGVDAELQDGRVRADRPRQGPLDRAPRGTPRYRGNGLPLMQALMDSVELTHDNGDGTAVRMARSLSPDRVAAEA